MKPQKAQMAQDADRDRFDQAINHVAARLTHVDDDPMLATRIVAALPDRVGWFGWLFHSWAPRLAVLAIIVAAGMTWSKTGVTPTPEAPLAVLATAPAITTLHAAVEPVLNRTTPLERLEPLERMEPAKADFDRSLAAIASPAALTLESLSPGALPEDAPLTIESLEIANLPLTESFSSR